MRARLEILWEDGDLLAVNKPAGLLTISGRQEGDAVRDVLALMLPASTGLRVVHRLDRETSGVLLLARTLAAQRVLSRQFRERTVEKTYLAIVRGYVDEPQGLIDVPIAPHPRDSTRMRVAGRKGRPSQTQWQVLEQWPGFALLRIRPRTGRQHQIRVHLAHRGWPLLVDGVYGGATEFMLSAVKPGYRPSGRHAERPLIARLTLHAESIAFDHPRSGERQTVTAPVPKDFGAVLAQLRKLWPSQP